MSLKEDREADEDLFTTTEVVDVIWTLLAVMG